MQKGAIWDLLAYIQLQNFKNNLKTDPFETLKDSGKKSHSAKKNPKDTDNTSMNNPETINNENQTNNRPSATSRYTMSRYGLRHNPTPVTMSKRLLALVVATFSLFPSLLLKENCCVNVRTMIVRSPICLFISLKR